MVIENLIARQVVDVAYHIHSTLGPGLLEAVYEEIMAYELGKRDFRVTRQQEIPVHYEQMTFPVGFRADLIVDDLVIIEIKSVEKLNPVHKKQLLTYLRLTGKKLGLLINFGEAMIKDGIVRIANGLEDE